MDSWWTVAGLVLLSSLKFFLAPSSAVIAGYGFLQTIAITIFGGFVGFFFFFYAGQGLRRLIGMWYKPKKAKKKFSRKNKLIVKVKRSYGLWGLALLTPCLFGIPIGALLASYYYAKQKLAVPIFLLCIVLWSFILTYSTIFVSNL